MVAMGGNLGLQVDAGQIPREGANRNDILLFSESAGRFVAVDPHRRRELSPSSKACPMPASGPSRRSPWSGCMG
jgi:hypothetical protein